MTTGDATNETEVALGTLPPRGLRHGLGRALWCANLLLLAALALWIFFDPRFPAAAQLVAAKMHVLRGGPAAVAGDRSAIGWRLPALWTAIAAAIITTLLLLVTLFVGSSTHRRLRSWLAFTMLVAAWLMLLVSWREFAWQGQRLRLRGMVAEFEPIAKSLRENWPTKDGERAGLGSYMAYPQGKPRMLMMLVSESDPQVSAIERSDDGALGFELRGEENGTWLEWHPVGSTPKTFVGGLEAEYDFGRTSPLGRGWYLVRYR